jgi:hypothetical protein
MKNSSDTTQQIRDEMRAFRASMDAEVDTFVASTRVLLDWHYYLESAPWFCLAAAALAGYFAIPSRPKVVPAMPGRQASSSQQGPPIATATPEENSKRNLARELVMLAAPFAWQVGKPLLLNRLKQILNTPPGDGPKPWPAGEGEPR